MWRRRAKHVLKELIPRQGRTLCPLSEHGCESRQPYSLHALAPLVSDGAYESQLHALKAVHEAKLSQQMEDQKKRREVQAEIERYEKLSALQHEAYRARLHVIENILILKCPRARLPQGLFGLQKLFRAKV